MTLLILATALLLQDPRPEPDAIRAGVKHLLEAQQEDGSWKAEIGESAEPGMRIAVTALCMHALARSAGPEEASTPLRRGLAFIEKNLDALDGPFESNPQFTFNPWGVAFGLSHLHGALARWPGAKPDVRKTVEALLAKAGKTQLACGGWTYLKKDQHGNPWKDGSVSFLSASMIDGLRRWKADGANVDDRMLERAVADLEKLTDAKGAAYYHTGTYDIDAGRDGALRTVLARCVLAEAGKGTPEALQEALDALSKSREEYAKRRNVYAHDKEIGIAGYYWYFGLHSAARALRWRGRDPAGHSAWLKEALLREQLEDGAWKDVEAGGKSCGTAFALLALSDLKAMRWRTIDEALASGKEQGKRVLVLFTDGKKEAQESEKALADPALGPLLDRFAAARVEIRKDDAACRKAGVSSGCALVVLDSALEDPWSKPVKKLTGRLKVAALKSDLEKLAGK